MYNIKEIVIEALKSYSAIEFDLDTKVSEVIDSLESVEVVLTISDKIQDDTLFENPDVFSVNTVQDLIGVVENHVRN